MMVMIDRMAQRYGLLPIDILNRASTFDMVCMDISLSMEKHWRDQEQPGYIPPVSEEELLKIKERALG